MNCTKGIQEEEYKDTKNVWTKFQIKTLQEYAAVYLKTVLLLADVFDDFKKTCLFAFDLDPAHYFTAPGPSIDAMLKIYEIKLEIFTDIDKPHFTESGI